MPTYDYVCDACSHKFEQTKMISERDQPISEPCPKCQKEGEVRRDWSYNKPGLGVDKTMTADSKTGGQWSELMEKMKCAHPKRFHKKFDTRERQEDMGRRWYG